MFRDTISLHSWTTSNQPASQTANADTDQHYCPPSSPWTPTPDPHPQHLINLGSEPFSSDYDNSFLFGAERTKSDYDPSAQENNSDFRLGLGCSFDSPDISLQMSCTSRDPWNDDGRTREEVGFSGWTSKAGAAGRIIGRVKDEWIHRSPTYLHTSHDSPLKLNSTFSHSPILQQPVTRQISSFSAVDSDPTLWGQSTRYSHAHFRGGTSTNYGSKCWIGQEKKRSGEAAGLTGTG